MYFVLDSTQTTAYLNRSLCYLKLNKPNLAIKDTSFVLEHDALNVKALYRRALAYKMVANVIQAQIDLENLLKIEPKNQMAQDELTKIANEKSKNSKIIETKPKIETIKSVDVKVEPKPTMLKSKVEPKFEPVKVKTTRTYDFSQISNGYEFLQAWNSINPKDIESYASLLENVEPASLPKFVGSKLDDQMFGALIRALSKRAEKVNDGGDRRKLAEYLKSIGNIQRFNIIKLFINKELKEIILGILNLEENKSELNFVKELYGLSDNK